MNLPKMSVKEWAAAYRALNEAEALENPQILFRFNQLCEMEEF